MPAKTVQHDHAMCPQLDFLWCAQRDVVVIEVYIRDSLWAPPSTGGHGGLHFGGEEGV